MMIGLFLRKWGSDPRGGKGSRIWAIPGDRRKKEVALTLSAFYRGGRLGGKGGGWSRRSVAPRLTPGDDSSIRRVSA